MVTRNLCVRETEETLRRQLKLLYELPVQLHQETRQETEIESTGLARKMGVVISSVEVRHGQNMYRCLLRMHNSLCSSS